MSKFAAVDRLIEKFFEALNSLAWFGTWKSFSSNYISSYKNFRPSAPFLKDPTSFLIGMAIVLKSPTKSEKGVIVIAYNYAFPTFCLIFDLEKVAQKYNLVLEPSTARYFMPEILLFKAFDLNFYIQTPENRDQKFISRYFDNAKTVPIAANWWIDDRTFYEDGFTVKEFDLVMVASWLKLKRHFLLFKALSDLKKKGIILSCVLVGYPIDLELNDIRRQAERYGVLDLLTFHEWLNQSEVADLYRKSRLNLLLSKREGSGRSIIEGFYCGTPCLIRQGFNFGQKYDYINKKTGFYFTDATLASDIEAALDINIEFEPSKWIHDNGMTAKGAAEKLSDAIYGHTSSGIVPKTSGLHGMEYRDPINEVDFKKDYDYLLTNCLINKINKF
jgi:glycosyltransferase involved in cell wall biosynthesis